jgi:hypothetical protein
MALLAPPSIQPVAGLDQIKKTGGIGRAPEEDWGPLMEKPVKRYTVNGKRMTPDDLRRLHDYLADMEAIEVISDEMRIVIESEWPEFVHKLPPRR